jgi:hypothetical protein
LHLAKLDLIALQSSQIGKLMAAVRKSYLEKGVKAENVKAMAKALGGNCCGKPNLALLFVCKKKRNKRCSIA